jgi:hypothetical protein
MDLAIIDDNNIWAVGEFHLRDSTGNFDRTMCNVLRWDGIQWNPQRLYYDYHGSQYLSRGDAVFAFGADDIWLSTGTAAHWDGHTLTALDLIGANPGAVRRYWGNSSRDLYMVSSEGRFTHFDGSSFSAIPTGVQSYFWDVHGSGDKVYIGSYFYDNQIRPSGVFTNDKSGFRFLFPDASDNSDFQALRDAFGVWASPQGTLWALGGPFIFQPLVNRNPLPGINQSGNYFYCIRGNSDSDVWVGGSGGTILHYNGDTWKEYPEASAGFGFVWYRCAAVKGNTVVFGGVAQSHQYAIVTLGRRVR